MDIHKAASKAQKCRAIWSAQHGGLQDFAGRSAPTSGAFGTLSQWLSRLITRRVPLDRWHDAFVSRSEDIKVVLQFDGAA